MNSQKLTIIDVHGFLFLILILRTHEGRLVICHHPRQDPEGIRNMFCVRGHPPRREIVIDTVTSVSKRGCRVKMAPHANGMLGREDDMEGVWSHNAIPDSGQLESDEDEFENLQGSSRLEDNSCPIHEMRICLPDIVLRRCERVDRG